MIDDREISDYRLKTMTQRYLRQKDNYKLKNLIKCGTSPIPLPRRKRNEYGLYESLGLKSLIAAGDIVCVVADPEHNVAQYHGVATCRSAWACPHCTPRVMSQKGRRIASALDALKAQNQSAFMLTLTLPHTNNMSCDLTFEILRETWRMFSKVKKAEPKTYVLRTSKVGKKGEVRTYNLKTNNPYTQLRDECEMKHHVRVYEFTYGNRGWHPHIHALFWVPNKHWKKILDYEEKLLDRWWFCAKRVVLKRLNKLHPEKEADNKKFVETFYADWRKQPQGHKALYLSKDENGNLIKQKSSFYLMGWNKKWGADAETAGLAYKKAKEGHYTVHQIYEQAYKAETTEERNKWLKLYEDYALATVKHRRVEWSNSGVTQIIDAWEKTHDTIETLKKKGILKEAELRVVCWFNRPQWSKICSLEFDKDGPEIKANILHLARMPNGKECIEQYLLQYDIDIRQNDMDWWRIEDINRIYAKSA